MMEEPTKITIIFPTGQQYECEASDVEIEHHVDKGIYYGGTPIEKVSLHFTPTDRDWET